MSNGHEHQGPRHPGRRETDGRIQLSFGQVTWAIGVLVIMSGAWWDLRWRVSNLEQVVRDQHTYTRSEIDLEFKTTDAARVELSRRMDRLEDQLAAIRRQPRIRRPHATPPPEGDDAYTPPPIYGR